ncbi:aminoacyl-tRNA hydrolase [Sandaracinobacteroides saxicola]|uniref:Peptidyl-tRNA hydrolase n=1 Tax=Sandaracinobacteroides saxicola TaxID=2759707 RepID=A0A7G5IL35_9SPHN|nr:aminoacyl-tRNA hydrolase [Sandaracinobacteroides saxicola]QMW24077.1 aminoacyl-tRNA hydrolase [Sandaracinobacteroides saxicola]
MQLFVGLGNPGPTYALHRHNVGFMALDAIHSVHGFAPWRVRFQGLASEGSLDGHKVLLLKPMTFMNECGRSVGEALRFFKLTPENVTAFYDELDLAPMKVRVRTGGGAAGHNGMRSLIAHLGPDFRRVRIGIGHPGHKDRVTGHVLGNYAKSELPALETLLAAIARRAPLLAGNDPERFMSDVALDQQAA